MLNHTDFHMPETDPYLKPYQKFFHWPSTLLQWNSHNIVSLLYLHEIYKLFIKREIKAGLVNFSKNFCVFNLILKNMQEEQRLIRKNHRNIFIHSFWMFPDKSSLSTIFVFHSYQKAISLSMPVIGWEIAILHY